MGSGFAVRLRMSVLYYWASSYAILALAMSCAILLLGAFMATEAGGGPIGGAFNLYYAGTHPLIILAMLYLYDRRVHAANYGGVPVPIYNRGNFVIWRVGIRALAAILVSLVSLALVIALLWALDVIDGADVDTARQAAFLIVFHALAVAGIYTIFDLFFNMSVSSVITAIVEYAWVFLPVSLNSVVAPYKTRILAIVGVNLNGTIITSSVRQESYDIFSISIPLLAIGALLCGAFIFKKRGSR